MSVRLHINRITSRIYFYINTNLVPFIFTVFHYLFLLQSLDAPDFFFLSIYLKVVMKQGLCIMNYMWGLLVMYFYLTGDLVSQLVAMVAERLSSREGPRCIVNWMLEVCSGMLCESCLRGEGLIESCLTTMLSWTEGKNVCKIAEVAIFCRWKLD